MAAGEQNEQGVSGAGDSRKEIPDGNLSEDGEMKGLGRRRSGCAGSANVKMCGKSEAGAADVTWPWKSAGERHPPVFKTDRHRQGRHRKNTGETADKTVPMSSGCSRRQRAASRQSFIGVPPAVRPFEA